MINGTQSFPGVVGVAFQQRSLASPHTQRGVSLHRLTEMNGDGFLTIQAAGKKREKNPLYLQYSYQCRDV